MEIQNKLRPEENVFRENIIDQNVPVQCRDKSTRLLYVIYSFIKQEATTLLIFQS